MVLVALSPAALHAEDPYDDEDIPAHLGITPEKLRLWNPVDPLALEAKVPEMRQLARRIAAGSTDPRLLREYHRLYPLLYPFDFVPREDGLERAVAAKEALEKQPCRLRPSRPEDPAGSLPPTGAWTDIGPTNIPGHMTSLALDPLDLNVGYAGGADGGVWKTTDRGATWTPLTDFLPTLAVGALAIDPTNPDVVYAGTGDGDYGKGGIGVFRSTDAGATWSLVSKPSGWIHKLVIDPRNTAKLYAATLGGVFVSTDSAATWTLVAGGYPALDTSSVVISSAPSSTVLLAGAGSEIASAQSGVYRSIDGGASWALLPTLPAGGNVGRIVIVQSPASPAILYVAIHDVSSGQVLGIYRSSDEGATFAAVNIPGGQPCASYGQCWYDFTLAVDAGNPDVVYLGTVFVFRSTDAGNTWASIGGGIHVDQHHVISPLPGEVWIANDGGVFRSTDQGSNWTAVGHAIETAQYYHITTHPFDDTWLIGGTQDNGVHRYRGTGSFDYLFGGDGTVTAISRSDPRVWYGEYANLVVVRSLDGGSTFTSLGDFCTPMQSRPCGISDSEASAWAAPYVLDRTDPNVVYAGTNRLYRSTDAGSHFQPVSGVLPGISSRGISTIDTCRDQPAWVWVGTSDGKVWYTSDSGQTWTDVSAGLPGRFVSSVAVHPDLPTTVYLSTPTAMTGTPHVWKTTDAGATWIPISNGMPDTGFNQLLVVENLPSSVVGAAGVGVYRSDDEGQSWSVYGSGLPNAAVESLSFSPATGTLRAATFGRGIWQLVRPGSCAQAPQFGGLETVRSVEWAGGCAPELSWQPGVSRCAQAPSLHYDIYRSATPVFSPGPATLLASGLTATSFVDPAAVAGTPYYYVVRAEDGQTGLEGPTNGGREDPNLEVRWLELGDPAPSDFSDDGGDTRAWSSGAGWSVSDAANTTPAGRFSFRSVPAGHWFYSPGACSALETPDLVLGAAATLSYQASYNLDDALDGVVVQVSTDRGGSWTDHPPAGGYPGTLASTNPATNACGLATATPAFTGPAGNAAAAPFQAYRHDLSALGGQTARFRWLLSTDASRQYDGFFLDDIHVAPSRSLPAPRCACLTPGAPDVLPRAGLLGTHQPSTGATWTVGAVAAFGTWNLHSTPDKSALPTIWQDAASVQARSTVKAIVDPGNFPPGFYQVYGAEFCTGTSVP